MLFRRTASFSRLGTVEGGYRHESGEFEDIILFYKKA